MSVLRLKSTYGYGAMFGKFAKHQSSGELVPKPRSPFRQDEGDDVHKINKYLRLAKFSLLGAGLLLLGVGVVNLKRPPEPSVASSENILPVETLKAKPVKSYQEKRTYTGEVAALRASELGFERAGKLTQILVDEGEAIAAGTPIAQLDISSLNAQRQQLIAQKEQAQSVLQELEAGPRPEKITAARAAVKDLEAQLTLEQNKRSRREFLYAQGAITKEQLDEVSSQVNALEERLLAAQSELDELVKGTRTEQIDAQKAAVKQLEAQLAEIDITIAKSTLKAPFAGTMAAHRVDQGTVVSAGQAIVRLVEAKPEARIGIPASVADRLKIGSQQEVAIGAKTYQAQLSAILPEVNTTARTQTVLLALDPSAAAEVDPGEIARWQYTQEITTEGYWLPAEALVKGTRGLWSCYVLGTQAERSGKANPFRVEQKTVEVLHQESDRVLVRGTLQSGDRLIASGVHRLVPGQLVTPTDR